MTKRYESTPMGKKLYYTYELSYPQGFFDDGTDLSYVVFYVGKGTVYAGGVQRIDEHESKVSRVEGELTGEKGKTIQRIWARGMSIQKRITFETDIEREAFKYETESIRRHDSPYLTNKMRPFAGPVLENHPAFALSPEMIDKMLSGDWIAGELVDEITGG